MSGSQTYVDTILPLSLPQTFTYAVPDDVNAAELSVGKRIMVPFGKRKLYTAVIVNIHQNKPEGYEVKPFLSVLDDQPIVRNWQFKFWNWLAEYYMCTLGDLYNAALPAGLKIESETSVFPGVIAADVKLGATQKQIYETVIENPGIKLSQLELKVAKSTVFQHVKKMAEWHVLSFEEIVKDAYKAKMQDYIILDDAYCNEDRLQNVLIRLEKRAPKQTNLLITYLQESGYLQTKKAEFVAKDVLYKKSQTNSAVLAPLVQKEIFRVEQKTISRFEDSDENTTHAHELNEHQYKAYTGIKNSFKEKDVTLLHGVTSSGKTEIYIHLIQECIAEGKQVLYLVPEIALTSQIINRLQKVFGEKVGIYHSKYNDAQRTEVWNNLMGFTTGDRHEYDVVLGVRSSVLLPFRNLGLIIVDEEHENTYKQYEPAPRYNARDASVVLAAYHKAKVLLGTATPSIESYFNVKQKKYALVELFQRFQDIRLPEVEVIDMKKARKQKNVHENFSRELLDKIDATIKNKGQVILFQNRRGFAPFVECNDCGWIPYCENCDVSLTYHKHSNRLTCHYCGFSIANPQACRACGSTDIQAKGFGTEKVEDDLKLIFPDYKIARLDLDTTRNKRGHEKIITAFQNHEVDILIGTQMVSKGLDFDNVKLVGILNADNMLNFPDFRAHERSYQLMAQVSGRAGRKGEQGRVSIQSSNSRHPILKQVGENDYQSMYEREMQERLKYYYPPAIRLLKLTVRHRQADVANQASELLAKQLRGINGIIVLGPEFPIIARVFKMHQKCIWVKMRKGVEVATNKKRIQSLIDWVKSGKSFRSVQVVVDVDPF